MSAAISRLRRRQFPVNDPSDNVTLHAVMLRCCVCGQTWPASLGEFGDEIPERESTCPRADQHHPVPPAAA